MASKYAEDTGDPDDPDESCIDLVHDGGEKALEVYRQWKAKQAAASQPSGSVILSTATKEYLATKPYGPAKTTRECEHALDQFKDFMGDVALTSVTSLNVHEFAEHVGHNRSKKLINKKLGYVRRMFDHAVRKGWIPVNVFVGIRLDKNLGTEKQSYVPLAEEELHALFALEMPTHIRRLFPILITSGMRLDEAALLNWENVKYDRAQDVTYFDLTSSIVKNKGSQRKVPVHPVLDWVETGRAGLMFPEFPRDRDGKTQSASSKALMPHIRKITGERTKAVHSLRGNFKDMLRDAGVAKEINDFITGHDAGDVAGSYGSGPSLRVGREAVGRLSFPYL